MWSFLLGGQLLKNAPATVDIVCEFSNFMVIFKQQDNLKVSPCGDLCFMPIFSTNFGLKELK